eukprot:5516167-Prymnesium_polylepis.1
MVGKVVHRAALHTTHVLCVGKRAGLAATLSVLCRSRRTACEDLKTGRILAGDHDRHWRPLPARTPPSFMSWAADSKSRRSMYSAEA